MSPGVRGGGWRLAGRVGTDQCMWQMGRPGEVLGCFSSLEFHHNLPIVEPHAYVIRLVIQAVGPTRPHRALLGCCAWPDLGAIPPKRLAVSEG